MISARDISSQVLKLPVTLLERIKVAANRRRPLSVADQDVAVREGRRSLRRIALNGVPGIFEPELTETNNCTSGGKAIFVVAA